MTATNLTTRILISLLVMAGILECAICVAAHSLGRRQAEASLAQATSQAEEARKDAADRLETAERENADFRKQLADFRKQLEVAKADMERRAEKLAAAEKEALRLRGELDATLKHTAELNQKYEARLKTAEDAAVDARDAERRARLEADSLRKDRDVTVVRAPAAQVDVVKAGNQKRKGKNGKNNNVAANKKHGGPVASLPRTSPSFSELDTDHDGRLSLQEYKVGYPDAPNVEEEFKALDTNHDGTLSIDEYKAGHPDPPVVHTRKAKQN